jgi:hypothetical protein
VDLLRGLACVAVFGFSCLTLIVCLFADPHIAEYSDARGAHRAVNWALAHEQLRHYQFIVGALIFLAFTGIVIPGWLITRSLRR